MNEGLDTNNPVAMATLLVWELDFGMTMAENALLNRQLGSYEEYERCKHHATDALASCACTAGQQEIPDDAAARLHELARRVSVL